MHINTILWKRRLALRRRKNSQARHSRTSRNTTTILNKNQNKALSPSPTNQIAKMPKQQIIKKKIVISENQNQEKKNNNTNSDAASTTIMTQFQKWPSPSSSPSTSQLWDRHPTVRGRFDFIHKNNNNNNKKNSSSSSSTRDVNELLKNNNSDSIGVPKFVWNFSQFFVRPLHNFFQQQQQQQHSSLKSFQKDNADEIQIMLIPIGSRYFKIPQEDHHHSSSSPKFHCFVATNSEQLNQKHIDEAFSKLKIGDVYKIKMPVRVVHGEKGRHAEQKLIDYLSLMIKNNKNKNMNSNIPEAEKAIIVGERLPCAACRAFIALADVAKYVVVPKSHGHLYVDKTLPLTPLEEKGIKTIEELHAVLNQGNKVCRV